jgi:hypothetical protein
MHDPTCGSNGPPATRIQRLSFSRCSRPRDFEHPTLGLSTREPPSSRGFPISATCLLQMDGSQPPRHFAASWPRVSRLLMPNTWAFTLRAPSPRDLSISDTCPFRWTVHNPSPLRCLVTSRLATFNANFLTLPLTSSRDARCHLSSNGQNLASRNLAILVPKSLSPFSRGPDTRSREQSNSSDRLGSMVLPLLSFESSPRLRCNCLAPLGDPTALGTS